MEFLPKEGVTKTMEALNTLIQESNTEHDKKVAEEAVKGFVQEYSIYLPVSVLDKYLSTKSESNEGEGKLNNSLSRKEAR